MRSTPLFLAVSLFAGLPLSAQTAPQVRTYYIAADEVMWDYAPSGMDQIRGLAIDSARPGLKRPGALSTVVKKAVYREYTDATFKTLKPRTAEWEHLGLLGPVVRGVVGDTIKFVFRNNASRPYSVHPHGVFYNKDSEGTPYRDGTQGADKNDDAVPPSGTHTYVWPVPERAGPGPHDGSSVMWMYHSHTDEGKDVPSGLMGAMLITAQGQARADGSPIDIDREFVINFDVIPEGFTHYLKDNLGHQMPWVNADSLADDDDFKNNRNFFDTMNGFIWGNMPMPTVEQGERVRWYVMASTTEFDFHTPHWHGNTVLVHGNRQDIISVEPMMMVHADMVADNPGVWLFHCHVKIHMEGGMQARYAVLPRDPARRMLVLDATRPLLAKASAMALPTGWKARPDQTAVRPDQLRFTAMGDGFHATLGPAAIFYDPSRTGQGAFRAHATFAQTRPCNHPEAYGLFIGGRDLDQQQQSYLYFIVQQDGKYMIKHRQGSETHTVVDWTTHSAVHKLENGKATNQLAVEVSQQRVTFLVNGTEVASLSRDRFVTDGVVGLRINHNVDLHIADYGVDVTPKPVGKM